MQLSSRTDDARSVDSFMYRRALIRAAALTFGVLLLSQANAQSNKPISLVVGYSAGGSSDLIARIVAPEMTRRLGRQIVIENLPGASGTLAAQRVLSGPADGSLIYMGGNDTVAVPLINPKVKHDWAKDFVAIGRMTTLPMVFAVPSDAPYSTLTDLIRELGKSGKGNFNYASPGIGSTQHFYGELINNRAKVSMRHIPYRGGAQVANDLVGHQIDGAVLAMSTAMPFIKDGKIKAISVSDATRVPQLSSVKPIGEEEGFKGLSLNAWNALFLKTGTSPEIAAAYEKALLATLEQPDVRTKLQDAGIVAAPMDSRSLKSFITPQAALYHDIITSAKIVME